MRLSQAEEPLIVPPLAVFSSLFGYLLVTVHDTEFYGSSNKNSSPLVDHQQQAAAANNNSFTMPFSRNDLVPMSLLLRDLALGLVELAYPESRPVVGQEYQQAVRLVCSFYFYADQLLTEALFAEHTKTDQWRKQQPALRPGTIFSRRLSS